MALLIYFNTACEHSYHNIKCRCWYLIGFLLDLTVTWFTPLGLEPLDLAFSLSLILMLELEQNALLLYSR